MQIETENPFRKISEKDIRVIGLLEEFHCCPDFCQWFFEHVFPDHAAAEPTKCTARQNAPEGVEPKRPEIDLVVDYEIANGRILRAIVEVKVKDDLDENQQLSYQTKIDRDSREFAYVQMVLVTTRAWWNKRKNAQNAEKFTSLVKIYLEDVHTFLAQKQQKQAMHDGELARRLGFKVAMIGHVMR